MKGKVSLCVITGNAEKYVERFLDSFQPHFDEVVVVRAIGCQEADRTLEIAEARGCKVGEYFNDPARPWPHVDDFAAARNTAFDLAGGDWLMWADLDDVLVNGPEIRRVLEDTPESVVGVCAPYDVKDDQVRIFRERIVRRGAARWESPVHEHLEFTREGEIGRTQDFELLHMPSGSRRPNDERNVRILESIGEPSASHRFHLVQSLRAVGRAEDAVAEASKLLLEQPEDLGRPEKVELYMCLAQLTPDPGQRASLILQSLGTDPTRREAYGELALTYLASNRPVEAEAMARAMMALDRPEDPPWNLRWKFYGYAGLHVLTMALRAQGKMHEADARDRNHFVQHGAKISLLHATRGRGAQAVETRKTWLEAAENPDAIEHIFGLDADDPDAMGLMLYRHEFVTGDGGPVEAWNACARSSAGEVLVQLSDDWVPPLGWDRMILEAIGDTSEESVLEINDSHRDDDLLCMAICTRPFMLRHGDLFHPEFFSMFSDNWFTEQAKGSLIQSDIRFDHQHPVFCDSVSWDETYARSNQDYHYVTGQRILNRLREGVLTSAMVPGWFDFRQVYDHLAKTLSAHARFVEVGCWKGKSLIYLLQRLQDMDKQPEVWAVDTFEGDDETGREDVGAQFLKNMRAAQVDAKVLALESVAAAAKFKDRSLDGAFLDAAHDEASVAADIAAWSPKVKPGGFLGGHDADSPGVQKALADAGVEFERVGRCWVRKEVACPSS